jgi:hypothetical protein
MYVYRGSCGAQLPNSSQYRTPRHGGAGSGARKRNGPNGGRAYGMERHLFTPLRVKPWTVPPVVMTLGAVTIDAAACQTWP